MDFRTPRTERLRWLPSGSANQCLADFGVAREMVTVWVYLCGMLSLGDFTREMRCSNLCKVLSRKKAWGTDTGPLEGDAPMRMELLSGICDFVRETTGKVPLFPTTWGSTEKASRHLWAKEEVFIRHQSSEIWHWTSGLWIWVTDDCCLWCILNTWDKCFGYYVCFFLKKILECLLIYNEVAWERTKAKMKTLFMTAN